MATLTITKGDGTVVNLPEPIKLSYARMELSGSESGRDNAGDNFIDYIATKRKLEVEWGTLTSSQMSTLLQATEETFFQLTFPDAYLGTSATMTCNKGDRVTSGPAKIR